MKNIFTAFPLTCNQRALKQNSTETNVEEDLKVSETEINFSRHTIFCQLSGSHKTEVLNDPEICCVNCVCVCWSI
ncbi:CLUMA_CG004525, isoform A [Clunio marinus]|uniref:CLUMA_CG004525, isoform A n=1 Tax=Clunio marinus TaxID=568069 RepID=A0A1J1HS78_9DIPT|nr:CLUMA_CG004525, isoform A [Clunio marinus]